MRPTLSTVVCQATTVIGSGLRRLSSFVVLYLDLHERSSLGQHIVIVGDDRRGFLSGEPSVSPRLCTASPTIVLAFALRLSNYRCAAPGEAAGD